jgi:hypothetical protein
VAVARFDRNRVFNTVPRRIFRRSISRAENVTAGLLLGVLVAAGAWVLAQRDAYDPGERDISAEALESARVQDTLYRTPLKPWTEPGSTSSAGAAGIAQAAATPDLGLFPRGILDDGWRLEGRVDVFDPDTLYTKIDGAAEQYLAFGFRRLYYATIVKDADFINLEIYDQGDVPGTIGIFAAQRDAGNRLERLGQAYFYRTPVGALGIAGTHYFKVSGSAESPAIRAKADALVPLLARAPGSATPSGLGPFRALTDGLKVPFDGIAFEKANVFGYEFLGDTWFGKAGRGDARYFVHEAKGDGDAGAVLARLAQEHENEYTAISADGTGNDRRLYKHKFLDAWFAVERRGALLFGIDAAPDRASAESLLRRLEEVLADAAS